MATVTKSIGTGKTYTTIASWESDLDNDTPYDAGDDVIGEMYDETYDESVTINGGSTLGLNSITLSSESASNRHDGTAGSGARIVKSGNSQALVAASTVATVIEWIEVDAAGNDANGGASYTGIVELQDSDSDLNNCIVHDVSARTSQFGPIGIEISTDGTGASEVNNCIVYDIQGARDSSIAVIGIYCPNNISALFYNNTVYNTGHTGTGSTSAVKGMSMTAFETPSTEQKNNAIFGTFTDGTISDVQDLDNTVDVDATNATSDGTGSSGLQNLTASSQFVSLTAGSEDLHIVTGADLKDAGTNLGAITAAVDINGRNRDTEGDTWDIGAHEFVAVSGTTVTPSAGQINFTGQTPTVGKALSTVPSPGVVRFTGQTPSAGKTLATSPSPGTVNFSGQTPSVGKAVSVNPASGIFTFGGQTPTTATFKSTSPTAGILHFDGIAPTVGRIVAVNPTAGTIQFRAGPVPIVEIGGETNVAPSPGTVQFLGNAPTVSRALTVAPTAGVFRFTGAIPSVSSIVARSATPAAGILQFLGIAPTVTISTPVVSVVTRDDGAGAGRWDEITLQLQSEDELLLQMIAKFVERLN